LVWSIDEDATPTVVQAPAPSALDARKAPAQVGYSSALYTPSPDAILLDEGFEDGVVPPAGWTQVTNNPYASWQLHTMNPHSGSFAAEVLYDYSQDEWLLSPEFALTQGTLSLWSFGSPYWCRDTYDNCDLNVWLVVGEVGGGDDVLVGRADDDWTGTYIWSQSVFDLTPLLPGGAVRIGLQYNGSDGAQIALDDVILDGTSGGACTDPVDIPWFSLSSYSGATLPGDSVALDATFDSTGLAAGSYTGNLCVNSNDPATPLVVVPVELTVEPGIATDSELCTFDYDTGTDEHDFDLLFTPKKPAYELTASNPGQFFYNVFYVGDGPATIELALPYPFVTQGARAVHVYGDVGMDVNGDGQMCFTPGEELAAYRVSVKLGDHVDTDGDGALDSAIVTLTDVPVTGGFAYLNIHLDYGLKKGTERYAELANPDGTNDAVDPDTGDVLIADRTPYTFWVQFGGAPLDGGAIVNVNKFQHK